MKISIPSKTFLLGEYLVLSGGPGIVVNTAPSFHVYISNEANQATGKYRGFDPQSPAGKFLDKNQNIFQDVIIDFQDPHEGKGGFGASSAQFAAMYALKHNIDELDLQSLIEEFQELAWDGTGFAPSGVDLISQIQGGITYFHRNTLELKSFTWPFTDIHFCLLHTGNKLATHEHLKDLNHFSDEKLIEIVETAYSALEDNKSSDFVSAIQSYRSALHRENLIHDHTLSLLEKADKLPGILASKGCGALGADVILLIYETGHLDPLTQWAIKENLAMIATDKDISQGMLIEGNDI